MRLLADIQSNLSLSLDQGLATDAVGPSRQRFGRNQLTPLPRQPIWKKFIAKFDEPIIKILLAAALLSMVVDLFKANNLVGGVSLAVFAGLVTALFLRHMTEWLPSLLFVSAILMFLVGLGCRRSTIRGTGGHDRCGSGHGRRLRQ